MGSSPAGTSEVAARWCDLFAQISAKSILSKDAPPLTEYALGSFQPKLVLERLLDPRPTYFAFKDILFAGLCAWTVAPNHQHLVQEAMILAGATQLAAVERKLQSQLPQAPMLADIVTRIAGPSIDFYNDFYYPAGGLQRIIRARSPRLMQRSLQAASREIGYAVEMMRVCHDHARRLQDPERYRTASYSSGGQAVSDLIHLSKSDGRVVNDLLFRNLTKRTVDKLNCNKKAAKFLQPAALIYSAHSMSWAEESFLSLLCKGEVTFRKHGSLISEWIGRACYAAKHIISPMYSRDSIAVQIDYLPSVTPIEIAPPDYRDACLYLDRAFAIARTGSAAVRN